MWTRMAGTPPLTRRSLTLGLALLATACEAQTPVTTGFPEPQRPVAPIVSSRYSNEDARDSVGEFETVVKLAGKVYRCCCWRSDSPGTNSITM